MARVNVEQTANAEKTGIARPAPPSFAPPPRPDEKLDDDKLSTICGSTIDASSANTSPISSPRSPVVPSVITRDELLCFRQRRSATSERGGLHCVPKKDPRLPVETLEEKKGKEFKASELKSKPVSPPPGLTLEAKPKPSVAAPPGLQLGSPAGPPPYTPAAFRKEMMTILKDLALDKNVGRAVRRVRMHSVPLDRQAAELADAVTYSLEETRGAVRRTFVAFVAGLASAFEREKYIEGLQYFFLIGYADLEEEVPKLSRIVDIELLPALRSVLSEAEMNTIQVS